jgi:F0F1-type ATP synthase epsilon subunit
LFWLLAGAGGQTELQKRPVAIVADSAVHDFAVFNDIIAARQNQAQSAIAPFWQSAREVLSDGGFGLFG